ERPVARNVIGMIGADDHVSDWQRRNLPDFLDETLRRRLTALGVGDDNAVGCDDDEAVGGEGGIGTDRVRELFVGVNVVAQFQDSWEVALSKASYRHIPGPDNLREYRCEGCHNQGEENSVDAPTNAHVSLRKESVSSRIGRRVSKRQRHPPTPR